MPTFDIITIIIDLVGEWTLAISTLVLVFLIYRQIKLNQDYYQATTKPVVLVERAATSIIAGNLVIMLKNRGAGSAKNTRFWVYPDGEMPTESVKMFVGFLHPEGEHVHVLGTEEQYRDMTFHVGVEYEGLDDTEYEDDFTVDTNTALGMVHN